MYRNSEICRLKIKCVRIWGCPLRPLFGPPRYRLTLSSGGCRARKTSSRRIRLSAWDSAHTSRARLEKSRRAVSTDDNRRTLQ